MSEAQVLSFLYIDLRNAIRWEDGPRIVRHQKLWFRGFGEQTKQAQSSEQITVSLLKNMECTEICKKKVIWACFYDRYQIGFLCQRRNVKCEFPFKIPQDFDQFGGFSGGGRDSPKRWEVPSAHTRSPGLI